MTENVSFGAVTILALIAIVSVAAIVGPAIAGQNEERSTETETVAYSEQTSMQIDDVYLLENSGADIDYSERFDFGGGVVHNLIMEHTLNGITTGDSYNIGEGESETYLLHDTEYIVTVNNYDNSTGTIDITIDYEMQETVTTERDGANRLWNVALLLMALLVVAIFIALVS